MKKMAKPYCSKSTRAPAGTTRAVECSCPKHSEQGFISHRDEKRVRHRVALHRPSKIRQQTAHSSLRAQDHTTIMAVLHLGTRHGGPAQEVIKRRKNTPAGSSRQVHQVDRSSAHHQLHSPHGSEFYQINHLQVRGATQHHHGQRTNFTAAEFQNFREELGIKINYASVAHPQSNGQVEKANGLVCGGLKKRLLAPLEQAAGNWVEELLAVLWSLRTTPNTMTQYTPFFMVYGTEAVLPHDLKFGAPRVTGYEEEEAEEALRDDKDTADEARDTALAKSEG